MVKEQQELNSQILRKPWPVWLGQQGPEWPSVLLYGIVPSSWWTHWAELIGGKRVQAIAIGLTAALTCSFQQRPILAARERMISVYLVALRVSMGICEGATSSRNKQVWWPDGRRTGEKGQDDNLFIMAGSQAGTLVGFSVRSYDWCFGWETLFTEGGCCFVWLALDPVGVWYAWTTPHSKQELDTI